jgi:hypothetical protein
MSQDEGFLSRWSRRKVQVARGDTEPAVTDDALTPVKPAAGPALPSRPTQAGGLQSTQTNPPHQPPPADPQADQQLNQQADAGPPAPTLEEARQLTPDADFTRFVGRDVDPQVKNAALKNLFSDPQFNVMDGLDIYIDDYGKPDPLPPGMLERMTQSAFLGLFRKTPEEEAAALAQTTAAPGFTADESPAESDPSALPAPTEPLDPPPDEDPDLRLQRHDDAGRAGPGEGPEPDPGRQR